MAKKLKPLYVKWLDHYSCKDSWGKADYSESKDGMPCESVGFLMRETKKSIHLALNFCYKPDGMSDSSDSMCILKSCILKRKYLK